MKVLSAKKTGACLLLVAHLCSCVGLDTGDSSERSSETQNVGDGSSVNQPETVVVSGGGANVDVSNQPEVSDFDELPGDSPCDGLLWKPISESDGNLAILSDFGDVRQWSSVSVYDATEGDVEFCAFAGLTPEADRQIWRCGQPGEFYTGEFDIEFSGEKCSGAVEDPAQRND